MLSSTSEMKSKCTVLTVDKKLDLLDKSVLLAVIICCIHSTGEALNKVTNPYTKIRIVRLVVLVRTISLSE